MKKFSIILCFVMLICCCWCVACNGKTETTETQVDEKSLYNYIRNSVVLIDCAEDQAVTGGTYGSGVVLSKTAKTGEMLIVTNLHVIKSTTGIGTIKVRACDSDASVYLSAHAVCCFEDHDIAFLACKDEDNVFPNIRVADMKDKTDIYAGKSVRAVGNALGKGIAVTSGIISKESELLSFNVSYRSDKLSLRQIRVDCALNHGCSGGGLFSEDGKFLGLLNARFKSDDALLFGYAIPKSTVKAFYEKVSSALKNGKDNISLFYLGADIDDVGTTYRDQNGIFYAEHNVTVKRVTAGTVASMFLESGDIIRSVYVNGTEYPVTSADKSEELLLNINVGDQAVFRYERDGENKEYTVKVSEYYIKKIQIM